MGEISLWDCRNVLNSREVTDCRKVTRCSMSDPFISEKFRVVA